MFTAEGAGAIRYGLGAIKGVGQSAVETIVEERARNGPYPDLFDFCRRIDSRKVNRRALEAMIRAGALDRLGPSRASLMQTLTQAMQAAEQYGRAELAGQDDLFGGAASPSALPTGFAQVEEWGEEERLAGEKETLGLYFSGHPIARFRPELSRFVSGPLAEIRPAKGETQVVAGLVVALRVINTRKGRMAIATLDDGTGRAEAVVYADAFQRYRDILAKDRLLVAQGEVDLDEMSGLLSVMVESLLDIEGARSRFARRIAIEVDRDAAANGFVDALADALEPHRRGAAVPVMLRYEGAGAAAGISLGDGWRVVPRESLLARLRTLAGPERVSVQYVRDEASA
jgi:DNA polymerase-3 subunit alpha